MIKWKHIFLLGHITVFLPDVLLGWGDPDPPSITAHSLGLQGVRPGPSYSHQLPAPGLYVLALCLCSSGGRLGRNRRRGASSLKEVLPEWLVGLIPFLRLHSFSAGNQ